MIQDRGVSRVGVLVSGGLDSCILAGHLLEHGHSVQPFYVRAGLAWEADEVAALERFLATIETPRLERLITFELPVADLYEAGHWSLTGDNVPDATTPDDAVFLPGRNLLLISKAAIWCQLRGIKLLAIAPLGTSPFADASNRFFACLQSALNMGDTPAIELLHPFAGMAKADVMRLGNSLPLELTFSCISPRRSLQCGSCNKCVERQAAFASVGRLDLSRYANSAASSVDLVSEEKANLNAPRLA